MKALFISFDGIADPLGKSQILPYLNGLSNLGVEIFLISLEKKAHSDLNDLKKRFEKNSSIKYFPLKFYSGPKGISTLLNLKQIRSAYRSMRSIHNFDLIHFRSLMPFVSIRKEISLQKTPFIFDMRGFWADERIDGQIWNPKRLLFQLTYNKLKSLEQTMLSRSASVISLTENSKTEMAIWGQTGIQTGSLRSFPIRDREVFKGINNKVKVIPTCVDLDHFDPTLFPLEKRSKIKSELGFSQKSIIMCYQGSIGTWYQLEEMVEFFLVNSREFENLHWLIISNENIDDTRKKISSCIDTTSNESEKCLSKIRIINSNRSEMPKYLSITDFGMFFILPSFSKKASSATKTGEFLAMGKAIVSNRGWGDMEVLNQKYPESIFLKDNFDLKTFLSKMDQPDLVTHEKKARGIARSEFSLQTGINKYYEVYKNITK